jgi:hypothetical protein
MKLEAFHGRGNDDVMGSHDLEDLTTVIDGRAEIVDELRVAAPDVRSYVVSELHQLPTRLHRRTPRIPASGHREPGKKPASSGPDDCHRRVAGGIEILTRDDSTTVRFLSVSSCRHAPISA